MPNWPRALQSAVKLMQQAYCGMEMPVVREMAEQMRREKAEAEEN